MCAYIHACRNKCTNTRSHDTCVLCVKQRTFPRRAAKALSSTKNTRLLNSGRCLRPSLRRSTLHSTTQTLHCMAANQRRPRVPVKRGPFRVQTVAPHIALSSSPVLHRTHTQRTWRVDSSRRAPGRHAPVVTLPVTVRRAASSRTRCQGTSPAGSRAHAFPGAPVYARAHG